jgi:NADP-dependent 3-hydroxy acid dehydrogenase YdfG
MNVFLDCERERWTLSAYDGPTICDEPCRSHEEKPMKRHGGHVVVIGGSRRIGLSAARLARHRGAEVTRAGRPREKLLQAPRALGKMHAVVMEITDEGAVEKGFAGFRQVDQKLISAGTMPNDAIVQYDRSSSRVVTRERQ